MRNLLAALLLCAPAVLAQTSAPAAQFGIPTDESSSVGLKPAPAPIVSPEVLPDHRVVFRLRSPNASEVTVAGDFWVQQGRTEQLVKGDKGVWSLTTDPLPPDLYSYWFTVDGVRIPDPSNNQIKQGVRYQQSMFAVPGPDEAFLEPAPVPHGQVRMEFYQATALGKLRRMHIYLPPGYAEGKTQYPVAYLFHGGGDDDWGWTTVGRVNFILDNLIAQGKAKPMIVVMPSLWGLEPPISSDRFDENEVNFQKTFVQDIMPFVDSHYRVLPGAANRAVGGLGPGRDFLPQFLWSTLDKFGYAFFVSGGAGQERVNILQKQNPGVIDNPANIKRVKFFLGDGVNDSSIDDSRFLTAELKRRGYTVTRYETIGTHGWPSFRRCFAEFAQIAFR
jgi:enterochelin esterase-like enzyme